MAHPAAHSAFSRMALFCLAVAALAPARSARADEPAAAAPIEPAPSAAPAADPNNSSEDPAVLAPPPARVAPVTPPPVARSAQPRQPSDIPAQQTNIHALGAVASYTTGAGFAYRHYFGDTQLQISAIGLLTDRGNSALAFGGVEIAQYLMMWYQPGGRGWLPQMTSLRAVAGATYYYSKTQDTSSQFTGSTLITTTTTTTKAMPGIGAGLGFEFGGVMRSGFSLTLDILLTAGFEDSVLSFIYPLPALSIFYNW